MKNAPNYREANICRNCAHAEVRPFGRGVLTVGYYCKLYNARCCKTKVCDSHEIDLTL